MDLDHFALCIFVFVLIFPFIYGKGGASLASLRSARSAPVLIVEFIFVSMVVIIFVLMYVRGTHRSPLLKLAISKICCKAFVFVFTLVLEFAFVI